MQPTQMQLTQNQTMFTEVFSTFTESKCKCLRQRIQMQLSQNRKIFSVYLAAFTGST